jgi:hypothetical protein
MIRSKAPELDRLKSGVSWQEWQGYLKRGTSMGATQIWF